jgi:hypothetical protein
MRRQISYLARDLSAEQECKRVSNIQCTVLSVAVAFLKCLMWLDTVNRSSWLKCVFLLLCTIHSSINQWRTHYYSDTLNTIFFSVCLLIITYLHFNRTERTHVKQLEFRGIKINRMPQRTENTGACLLPLPNDIHFCVLHKITLTSRTTISFLKILCTTDLLMQSNTHFATDLYTPYEDMFMWIRHKNSVPTPQRTQRHL